MTTLDHLKTQATQLHSECRFRHIEESKVRNDRTLSSIVVAPFTVDEIRRLGSLNDLERIIKNSIEPSCKHELDTTYKRLLPDIKLAQLSDLELKDLTTFQEKATATLNSCSLLEGMEHRKESLINIIQEALSLKEIHNALSSIMLFVQSDCRDSIKELNLQLRGVAETFCHSDF